VASLGIGAWQQPMFFRTVAGPQHFNAAFKTYASLTPTFSNCVSNNESGRCSFAAVIVAEFSLPRSLDVHSYALPLPPHLGHLTSRLP
jgi:hypothetical protein